MSFLMRLKTFYTKNKKLFIIGSIALSFIVNSVVFSYLVCEKNKIEEKYNNLSNIRYNELSRSALETNVLNAYNKFKLVTKEELLIAWIKYFRDVKYNLRGATEYNQYSCDKAVIKFLENVYGAYMRTENVSSLERRAINEARCCGLKIRKRFEDIKPKDIIVFEKIGKYRHVGIVFYTAQKHIIYLDVNAKFGTYGIRSVRWGDKWVSMVFQISYGFFSNDL